jgi:hypothetical protein
MVHALIPVLGMQRQEHHELETSLGYIARPCLKKKPNQTKTKQFANAAAILKTSSPHHLETNHQLYVMSAQMGKSLPQLQD